MTKSATREKADEVSAPIASPVFTGNVGIGTSSPSTALDVSGAAGITSFTGTTKLGVVSKGSTAATDYVGYDFIGNSQTNPVARIAALTTGGGSTLSFGTSNSYGSGITNTAMTIDNAGDVALSGGVYLGGTATANKLDDYEEGTWTPSGTNLVAQGGRYTKVGNLVTCTVRFNAGGGASNGEVTGNIGGLPFTSSASISYESSGGGSVTWQNSEGAAWSCRVGANSAVNLHMYKGSSSAVLLAGDTAFLTFSYIAA
jgi:hypothetical protein